MNYQNTLSFAQKMDQNDSLKHVRKHFLIPKHKGKDVLYFCGNSLGLQPVTTAATITQELNDWANLGVEGHFMAKTPWFAYHEQFAKPLAKLVGAKPTEVVAMNQLTTNIHLLMVSFYTPTKSRYKIICEKQAFPSDQYALQSQVKFHGFDTKKSIVELNPRKGEHTLRNEDILDAINKHKNELALVFIGGVNYLSGQVFDMNAITKAAHKAGAKAGFDLAHAVGNIKLELHKWNVDFACWCSYKYLNSGPGSVGGAFVHNKHLKNKALDRFAGWWGHDKSKRFLMEPNYRPMPTAEAWQLSNAPVLSMAAHKAALDIFDKAGFSNLLNKSLLLTNYLAFVINGLNQKLNSTKYKLEIITPQTKGSYGCQLSIIAHGYGKQLHQKLINKGVIADWREPNIIRFAPVPLYNSFKDVYELGQILEQLLMP